LHAIAYNSRVRWGVLALCMLGSVAAASPVTTGTDEHVTRSRASGLPHMVFAQPRGGGNDLLLLAVTSSIAVGDLYDIIDEHGWAGQVRVSRVERTDDKCPGFFYLRASTQVVSAVHSFDKFQAVGVGPVRSADRAAHFVPFSTDHTLIPGATPPPGATDSLMTLIDLDGDELPELARYLYDCKGGPTQKWSGNGAACIEEWGRDRSGWVPLAHVEFSCH
jgi:hypothetical protein